MGYSVTRETLNKFDDATNMCCCSFFLPFFQVFIKSKVNPACGKGNQGYSPFPCKETAGYL